MKIYYSGVHRNTDGSYVWRLLAKRVAAVAVLSSYDFFHGKGVDNGFRDVLRRTRAKRRVK